MAEPKPAFEEAHALEEASSCVFVVPVHVEQDVCVNGEQPGLPDVVYLIVAWLQVPTEFGSHRLPQKN